MLFVKVLQNSRTRLWDLYWNLKGKRPLYEKNDFPNEVSLTGRYVDKEIFNNIVQDVSRKLSLGQNDTLIDFGCACGLMASRLAPGVKKVIGIDKSHDMISRARQKHATKKNIEFYHDAELESFDRKEPTKILCYSVIHYLSSFDQLEKLIRSFILNFENVDIILIGDIPSKKRKSILKAAKEDTMDWFLFGLSRIFFARKISVFFDPVEILALCNKCGVTGEIMPQNSDLPYCKERYDVLIKVNTFRKTAR